MKKIPLCALLLLLPDIGRTQILKLQAGMSVSRLDWQIDTNPNLPTADPLKRPCFSIGLDYLDKKYFNLSGNLGYVQKGDIVHDSYTDRGNIYNLTYKEAAAYFTCNTTIDFKYPLTDHFAPFISLGPRVDYFRLSSQDFTLMNHAMNKFNFGLNLGAGFRCLAGRYMAGIRADYLYNFNKLGQTVFYDGDPGADRSHPFHVSVKDRTFMFNLVLGYQLKAPKRILR